MEDKPQPQQQVATSEIFRPKTPEKRRKKIVEAYNEEDDDTETQDKEWDFKDGWQVPEDLKKLVSDLIMEEERELNSLEDGEVVMKRICEKLELWEKVECSTIDTMTE